MNRRQLLAGAAAGAVAGPAGGLAAYEWPSLGSGAFYVWRSLDDGKSLWVMDSVDRVPPGRYERVAPIRT